MPRPNNKQKTLGILKRKVSRLRSAVYIFVATSIFVSCLALFWITSYYNTEAPFQTYFSQAPQKPVAYLYLSPKQGNYKVGDEFPLDVLINTAASNVVAAAAYLSYDKKSIEALSIDVTGSIFNMTAEKEINTTDGKIKITLNKPSLDTVTFKGSDVRIATILFKAIGKTDPTNENIYFDLTKGSALYSAVFLNDKNGTNILDATRGAKIFIN